MSKPLSPETMALVKATAPALQQHGVEITTRMYQRLFVDPEIKALFDMAAHESGAQPKRLGSGSVIAELGGADPLRVSWICPHWPGRSLVVLYRVSQRRTLH